MPRAVTLLASIVFSSGLLVACQQEAVRDPLPAGRATTADDLLVVDCLLPGQVRKLGRKVTYLTARRPIQTTAQDCELRGGEYVAYDRANYREALGIWMPLAEQGDPDAQNKVGEIYERGLGVEPDYDRAAAWYRRAAEQGYERAQINLGFLLEKGLGLTRDPNAALGWYRKASKLPDAVLIDKTALDAQKARIAGLEDDLARSAGALERARQHQRETERRLQKERSELLEKLKQLQSRGGGDLSAVERKRLEELRGQLDSQRAELAQRRERITRLESQSRQYQERLLLLETEGASQREQLRLVREQLRRSRDDLGQYQSLAADTQRQLALTKAELAALGSSVVTATQARIRQLEARLEEKEQSLHEQRRQAERLQEQTRTLEQRIRQANAPGQANREAVRAELKQAKEKLAAARLMTNVLAGALEQGRDQLREAKAGQSAAGIRVTELQSQLRESEQTLALQQDLVRRLQKESDQWRRKLQQLQRDGASDSRPVADVEVPSAPPSIQLIEPPLLAVRGVANNRIAVHRGLEKRLVIGQVSAPLGIFAFTINGNRTPLNAKGLFEKEIVIGGDETPVNMVAIDNQGGRARLDFRLVAAGQDGRSTALAGRPGPLQGLDFGGFHALVIGNQDYQHLPDLETATADAQAVADVLRDRFGYQVILLRNATRYQILSELNKLRKTLTENDNLLVYYAGHGELDRVNLRGHWLPVDAEANSSANWISNVSITDILNAMSIRHVLMVSDSCYSGALTRSSLTQLEAGQSVETRMHWLRTLAKMRSRTALTSGGLAPVMDGGGGSHSVFAKAFLAVLKELGDVTEGQRVYREVSARVAFEANRFQVEQVPEYAPIKFSGHEAGDFLFVPRTL